MEGFFVKTKCFHLVFVLNEMDTFSAHFYLLANVSNYFSFSQKFYSLVSFLSMKNVVDENDDTYALT